MMEILRLAWPIAAVLAFVLSWKVVARWWRMRKNRKADDRQRDALVPLADSLGGTVVGSEAAAAWSAKLLGPLENHADDLTDKLMQRSRPRFDLALDFQCGPWHVRVSQASMRQQTGNGVRRLQEHRIEVATSLLAPMKIARHAEIVFGGRVVTQRREAPARPRTAEQNQADWLPLRLPPSMDDEFVVAASDLSSAARSFTLETLEWLLVRLNELPVLTHGRFMSLTFESGLVHATFPECIDPAVLISHVETIIGLLDRMPDVRPRHPAVAV
ncbi:hypothetical protein AB0A63_35360 [Lentzea sp. NPDC042327]|uniref:hypothetical protein n=1 Tax=Lentzea sp. NPDC042327 TaxID=3154801 RepID=UPI0033F08831